ncbi:MAG TPA: hypothetical protein VGA70_04935 [Longimicrobiales bacterium]
MAAESSTVITQVSLARLRRARMLRRVGLGMLFAFLGLGALNVFGVRSAQVSVTGGGYELTVTYAAMSRPGLATPWSVEVRRAGGFDGPVTVATTAAYFELFDENGLDPDPSAATTDGERTIWEFEPPPGEVLEISFDARISPAVQRGGSAETAVLVGGRPVVAVSYTTGVMP